MRVNKRTHRAPRRVREGGKVKTAEMFEHIQRAAENRVSLLLAREKAVVEKENELRGMAAVLSICEVRISEDPFTQEIAIVITRDQIVRSKKRNLAGILEEIATPPTRESNAHNLTSEIKFY